DPGFEDSTVDGGSTPPGWTFSPGTSSGGGGDYVFQSPTSHSGSFSYLFGYASGNLTWNELSQAVPTVPGQEYTLSFYLADTTPSGPRGFVVFWSGDSGYQTCDPRACPAGAIAVSSLGFDYTNPVAGQWEQVTATL